MSIDLTISRSKNTLPKLCVVGLGYVGLPTAAVFASRGLDVIGIDVKPDTVELINRGRVHITEPDLDILVNGAVSSGKLRATTQIEAANVFILAVPTPFSTGHKPDLSYLEAATKSIASVLEPGNLVILESTSPVGTTEKISKWLTALRKDLKFPHEYGEKTDIYIAHSPERVLPGQILLELTSNDRVVGGLTKQCAEKTAAFYKIAINGRCLLTTAHTAELVKLAENAYRDVNIAFANELSIISTQLDIDVWEAIELANHHPRVNILKPGPGVGGHCIAIDPWFIVESAPNATTLIQSARKVNNGKTSHIIDTIKSALNNKTRPTVAFLGLAYKANINDLRESPAVRIAQTISLDNTISVLIVEPYIRSLPGQLAKFNNVRLVDLETAYEDADLIVLLTDHTLFHERPLEPNAKQKIIDTRGIWR